MSVAPCWSGCTTTLDPVVGVNESLEIVLALLGKSAVTGSFAIIYLYSAELFPTEVRYVCSTTQLGLFYFVCYVYRSIGLGVASVGARVGGILSPLVLLLVSLDVLHSGSLLNCHTSPPLPHAVQPGCRCPYVTDGCLGFGCWLLYSVST